MRPLGVTLISLFMIAIGTVMFVSGLSLLISKDVTYPIFAEEYGRFLNQSMNISGVPYEISEEFLSKLYDIAAYIGIFFGAIYTVTGLGLFTLKEWGRIAAVVIAGFNVLYGIFLAFVQPVAVTEILLNLLVIWYLMRSDIRDRFTRKMSIEDRILGNQGNQNP